MEVSDERRAATAGGGARLVAALGVGLIVLGALGFLLARLIWLWYIFGLFFYLLAGLLAGSVIFPILRKCRPMAARPVAGVCVVLAAAGWAGSVGWEYRYIAESAGDIPHFSAAKNAMVLAGKNPGSVEPMAAERFRTILRTEYPPGGVIGYVRWALASGSSELALHGLPAPATQPFRDWVKIPHHGWRWGARAAGSVVLLWVGLWWQLAALRLARPMSNLIDADEADDLELEEIWEAGEPGYRTFEHTADVGLEARGKNWEALLEQSAKGLMATIGALVPDSADRGEAVQVKLEAGGREELVHDWLAEMLYEFETRRACIERIRFGEATERRIAAEVTWRKIDPSKSRFRREVKAVTYHELKIEPWKRGFVMRVVLDI